MNKDPEVISPETKTVYLSEIVSCLPFSPKGCIYSGDTLNGVRSGNGKMEFPNGDSYEGQWQNDKMNGKGKLTYFDGHVYQGNWIENQRQGQGK